MCVCIYVSVSGRLGLCMVTRLIVCVCHSTSRRIPRSWSVSNGLNRDSNQPSICLRAPRTCGCPRMILRTHPHGLRPRLCYSVTFTTVTFEDSGPPQSQPGESTRLGCNSQDGDSQHQETTPLLPQLNRLNDTFVWGKDSSTMTPIPS